MADIVRRIPWQLSNFGGTGAGGSYNLQDYQFDYAIGGIPFLSATRDKGDHEWAYTERMAEIRKDQFDNFAEPGEQSLYGWWLRSQSTFNAGAGVLYQDPDNDNQFNYRFADSLGIDPWTSGQISLLRETSDIFDLAGVSPLVRGFVDTGGLNAAWFTDGDELRKANADGTTIGVTFGFGTIQGLTSSGYTYVFSTPTGVRTGNDAGASSSLYTYAATNTTIAFVKARLVIAVDRNLYVAPLNGTPGPISTQGDLIYAHPNPNWIWTSITEGPNAIYAAGNDGTTGSIFKFTLTSDGEVLATYVGTISAQMPTGERINTIYGYIGTFVGIATSKGFRVGEIDGNGDVVYGPLLFEVTGGCRGITGFDRFMWTGSTNAHDGVSGLYRIDLGSTIQEQTTQAVRYAYARDIFVSAPDVNAVTSVDMLGGTDRKLFVTNQGAAWLESAADLVEEGYLTTGRIRFNTEEPKLYKFVSVRTPIPLQGDLNIAGLTQMGQEISYITYGPALSPGSGDVGTPEPNGPQIWLAFRFTLHRNPPDPTVGAVMNGWQVKALPGSIRQRIITHTFLLFDKETDKGGQRMGFNGYARERLQDFQALARAGDVVVFQELAEGQSTLVIIDDWQYTQLAPPGPNRESLGGYLTAVLRTVAEAT